MAHPVCIFRAPKKSIFAVLVLTVICIRPAQAQFINWPAIAQTNVKPTYDQPRLEYDPPGIELGSFLMKPSLLDTLDYDNNILASEIHRANDDVNTSLEEVDISSQWLLDSLTLGLQSYQEVYYQHPKEDVNLYRADIAGDFEITSTSSLEISGVGGQIPEQRADVVALSPNGNRPIYNLWGGSITYTKSFGPLVEQFRIGMDQIAFIYAADIFASHTDRILADRVTWDGHQILNPFIEAGYDRNDQLYHPYQQSFQNLTAVMGVHGFVDEVIDGEAAAGILRESYTNPAFETLVAPVVYGKVVWNVSPLTSINANVRYGYSGVESFCNSAPLCEIVDTGVAQPVPSTGPTSSNVFDTHRSTLLEFTGRIFVQHEIWHDLLGELGFEYDHYHFDLNDLIDNDIAFTSDLRYLISRNAEVKVDYYHRGRSTNLPLDTTFNTGPFAEDEVAASLKLQL